MPQNLTQTHEGHPLQVNGRELGASHEQIASILRSRLGQTHADLLAVPKSGAGGTVVWSTRLAGDVVLASSLPDEEHTKIKRWSQRLLNDIHTLSEQLRTEGAAASMVGHMLAQAIRLPQGDWLYSVGGKPVLVLWGYSDTPEASNTVQATSAASAAASVGAPAVGSSAVAAGPGGAGNAVGAGVGAGAGAAVAARRDPKPWLFGGLLLLLLAAVVLFGLKRCTDMSARNDDYASRIGEAEAANKALEEEIAKTRAQTPQFMCARPPEPAPLPQPQPQPPSTPEAEAQPTEPPQQAEAPKPDPYEPLAKRVAAAAKDCKQMAQLQADPLLKGNDPRAQALRRQLVQAMQQNCKKELIHEAKNMCPGQRPKELAPELVLVFDASGSMGFSLNVTDEEIQRMAQLEAAQGLMQQFLGGRAGPGVDLSRLKREPTRMSAARQAAVAAVRRVPSDANIGLVQIEQCPAARSAGFFPPARRGELLSRLQSIQPREGTPLADGVAKGGQMVDGVSREALMVVISDGRESCNQDPCAVAQALKRAKPHLKINVVDITGTGAGNCLAQATGGRVFTARNASEVAAMTRRAAEDAMGPENCPRP